MVRSAGTKRLKKWNYLSIKFVGEEGEGGGVREKRGQMWTTSTRLGYGHATGDRGRMNKYFCIHNYL